MLQTIALIVGAGVLNLSYFICGLFDSRITALARKRHSKDGYLIDLCRFAVLISLQVMFYVAVNLGQYEAFSRLSIHVISIAFLFIVFEGRSWYLRKSQQNFAYVLSSPPKGSPPPRAQPI